MADHFTNALYCEVVKHIGLTGTRRETLVWLVGLIMRHGTVRTSLPLRFIVAT